MRKIVNTNLEMVNNNKVPEEQIFSFNKLNSEREGEVDDVVKVLSALKDVAKAKKAYFLIKGENISYYNEAWDIYGSSFPDIFLDRMTKLENEKIKAYSKLFELVGGNLYSKITIPGKKSMYLVDILGTMEAATELEFKGIRYSRMSKEKRMSFSEYRYTLEFDEVKERYENEWIKGMKIIDDTIATIDMNREYAILNKDKEHKVECMAQIKVGMI